MFVEAHRAQTAPNDFVRHHHVRACAYFAISAVEAFLNQRMRKHLEAHGTPENEILKRLRSTRLNDKREKWPSEMSGRPFSLPAQASRVFEISKALRDEVTHPKRRDHSIYVELDALDASSVCEAVATTVVAVGEALGTPFPYWVLGWNYVGMNGDPCWPVLLNNMNGFYHSLVAMGFQLGSHDVHWDKTHMVSLADYHKLQNSLARYPADIEPYHTLFTRRPRLTRRWWDRDLIMESIREARRAAQAANGNNIGPLVDDEPNLPET